MRAASRRVRIAGRGRRGRARGARRLKGRLRTCQTGARPDAAHRCAAARWPCRLPGGHVRSAQLPGRDCGAEDGCPRACAARSRRRARSHHGGRGVLRRARRVPRRRGAAGQSDRIPRLPRSGGERTPRRPRAVSGRSCDRSFVADFPYLRGYTKNREGAGILRVKRVRLPTGCATARYGAAHLVESSRAPGATQERGGARRPRPSNARAGGYASCIPRRRPGPSSPRRPSRSRRC